MKPEIWWALVGIVMVIADLIFGTFFILFVGAGAIITSILIWAGILPDPTWQWVVFAVISTLGLVLFRNKLVSIFGKGAKPRYDEHVGQIVIVTEIIPTQGMGKVNYRGAAWQARSADQIEHSVGSRVKITQVDGIVLSVSADN